MSIRQYPDLFVSGPDHQMNACLNFSHDMSHGYIEGYLRAADRLVQHVAETGSDQDSLVYPIAFMYRQHIELQLKRIVDLGRRLLTNSGGHPTHHKVQELWPLVKGILRQVWNGGDPPEFVLIDRLIDQIANVDFDSTAFRFPSTTEGKASLKGIRIINLRHLAECVHSFSDFLQGAACGLAEYVDYKNEAGNRAAGW